MGNIAGVASALAIGGPGALFWMWIASLFGMILKSYECVLAVHYREVSPTGESYGGPLYYMEKGLIGYRRWPKLLVRALQAVFTIGFFSVIFITMANYTVQEAFRATFNLGVEAGIAIGLLYAAWMALVIWRGIPSVGRFASIAMPMMTIAYIGSAIAIIGMNAAKLPGILAEVVRCAFTPAATIGGFAGATPLLALRVGVARSVFSNEAGWGSSPHAYATMKGLKHPGQAALWAAMEVFIDTLIICTLTGLVVLVTDTWSLGIGGFTTVLVSFEQTLGFVGKAVLAATLFLFVFTTGTGWYIYEETVLRYWLRGKSPKTIERAVKVLRLIYPWPGFVFAVLMVMARAVPAVVWVFGDISTGIPVYVNLVAIMALAPIADKLIREYELKYM